MGEFIIQRVERGARPLPKFEFDEFGDEPQSDPTPALLTKMVDVMGSQAPGILEKGAESQHGQGDDQVEQAGEGG